MITFHCQHCGGQTTAGDLLLGKWIRCPACNRPIEVSRCGPDERSALSTVSEPRLRMYDTKGDSAANAEERT